jgi:hypothetical protein
VEDFLVETIGSVGGRAGVDFIKLFWAKFIDKTNFDQI